MSCPETSQGSPRRVRTLILADTRLYRDGLVRALSDHVSIEIIGAAGTDADGLQRFAGEAIDVILVDAQVERARTMTPTIAAVLDVRKIVVFGVADEEEEAIRCAEAGIAGYVTRDASLDQLTATLLSVAREEFPCSPRIAALMLRRIASLTAQRQGLPAESGLTPREIQILARIDAGQSNKQIGRDLGIELSTVKNHVHRVLEKLRVSRRGQAAAKARQLGVRAKI